MKKVCGLCIFFTLISIFIVACGGGNPTAPGNPSNITTPAGGNTSNTVGLAATTFAQNSITIKKGDSITLTNQTATVHIISNGTWNGNTPAPKAEPGAPVVSSLMFNTNNQSQTIGPFNQAGTFHYYCTVHPGMNLTVIVQ